MQQVLQDLHNCCSPALISILLQLAANRPFHCKLHVLLQLLVACCNLFYVLCFKLYALSFKFYRSCDVGFTDAMFVHPNVAVLYFNIPVDLLCRRHMAVSTVQQPVHERTQLYHGNRLDGDVEYDDRIANRWQKKLTSFDFSVTCTLIQLNKRAY